jgi:hypothetical protein
MDDGLQSGRIQIASFIGHKFSKYGEAIFFFSFFMALNKPHDLSTPGSHFFFLFAAATSINPHTLSW